MSNYVETKKELDRIKNEYGCKGEVLFKTALQYTVEAGQANLQDEEWVKGAISIVNKKHDKFEAEKKILWVSRDFEVAIIECAAEIAKVDTYDLLVYIQREVWLSNEGIDYQRAIELLKNCMYDIEERENCEDRLTYQAFEKIGFTDDEIRELEFGFLLN